MDRKTTVVTTKTTTIELSEGDVVDAIVAYCGFGRSLDVSVDFMLSCGVLEGALLRSVERTEDLQGAED